ncbi:hypothetical protein BDW68DRAFT_166969 [Aspergillus falconensis]
MLLRFFPAQTMSWRCFPSQCVPFNSPSPCPHTQDKNHIDEQPQKIQLLSAPWNQTQGFEIMGITSVRPPPNGQLPELGEEITAFGICPGGTTTKILTNAQVQSLPGGSDALARFRTNSDAPLSFNTTPPLPKDLPMEPVGRESIWMGWLNWVLKSRRRPRVLPRA